MFCLSRKMVCLSCLFGSPPIPPCAAIHHPASQARQWQCAKEEGKVPIWSGFHFALLIFEGGRGRWGRGGKLGVGVGEGGRGWWWGGVVGEGVGAVVGEGWGYVAVSATAPVQQRKAAAAKGESPCPCPCLRLMPGKASPWMNVLFYVYRAGVFFVFMPGRRFSPAAPHATLVVSGCFCPRWDHGGIYGGQPQKWKAKSYTTTTPHHCPATTQTCPPKV